MLTDEEFLKCKEMGLCCSCNENLGPGHEEEQDWLVIERQQVAGTFNDSSRVSQVDHGVD